MIEITDIRKTKRGRYALFCGEEFLFSVDAEMMADGRVCTGLLLDAAGLEELRLQSHQGKAREQALRYLSLRAYGQQELYQKLLQKHDEHTATAVIAWLCDMALLNDADFAANKAAGMAQRGKSTAEIRRKLAELGIGKADAQAALAGLELDEVAMATALVEKSYADKLRRGERQKVMAALARRGFAHRDIAQAIEAVAGSLAAEEDEAENAGWEAP